MLWPLAFLVLQVLCGIGVVIWECYFHRRKGIHRATRSAGRVLGTTDARSLMVTGPEDGVEHVRLSEQKSGGKVKKEQKKGGGEALELTTAPQVNEGDVYFWDEDATGEGLLFSPICRSRSC